MKHFISKIRFRVILPLLFLATLLTIPSTVTGSKYVWKKDIRIDLKITYPEQTITNILPDGYPSETWVCELADIRATAQADGLVLIAEEGYTLPESIIVEIGQMSYHVRSDGTNTSDGIAFAPETGLLSISETLMQENPGGVTVRAAAEKQVNPAETAVNAENNPISAADKDQTNGVTALETEDDYTAE